MIDYSGVPEPLTNDEREAAWVHGAATAHGVTDQRDLIAEARESNTPDDEAGFLLLALAAALEDEREQSRQARTLMERLDFWLRHHGVPEHIEYLDGLDALFRGEREQKIELERDNALLLGALEQIRDVSPQSYEWYRARARTVLAKHKEQA